MDRETFEEIAEKLKLLDLLNRKIEETKEIVKKRNDNPDSMDSYSFCCSKYADKSGDPLDLTGCYVGGECYQAILEVLKNKSKQMEEDIKELGLYL